VERGAHAVVIADLTGSRRPNWWLVALGVLVTHAVVLYELLQDRLVLKLPERSVTIAFIDAPKHERPADPPRSASLQTQKVTLEFESPSTIEFPEPLGDEQKSALSNVPVAPATELIAAAASTQLADELAVYCPQRTPPAYPPQSRRLREQGEVTLRVELDESGQVRAATVLKSSGSVRLDESAHDAVMTWRCTGAKRDGRPVRAVAIQTLAFVLKLR
jgi:periplasmic protein TonB